MYARFFGLKREPFSIAPDPRYLFMSHQHHEALAHLAYGANSGGGVVVLSGEIGTGKTTVCRHFLEKVPANCNVAYIFNPKLDVHELLQAICEEFHVAVERDAGVKDYVDALNCYLLQAHAQGRNNVLIIDEAQNLSVDVLEQLRLLTNLETNERKLLQIILIGQPELREILARSELEQLAQRVIARYHLGALSEQETASYIRHRLSTSGLNEASPFRQALMKRIHRLTQGVPRRINLLCDRALLGAYAQDKPIVDHAILARAARELAGSAVARNKKPRLRHAALGLTVGAITIGAAWAASSGALMKAIREGGFPAANSSPEKTSRPASMETAQAGARKEAPAAPVILSELEDGSRIGFSDETEALRQLFRSWGETLPDSRDAPCEAARLSSLRCYRSLNGLAELRQLDRPAVIRLRDGANRTYHALLTGLTDGSAMLRAGGTTQQISLAALTRYFRGEFIALWRAPSAFTEPIKPGASGPQVEWIANQLAKIYGDKKLEGSQVFDQAMLKRIREFQGTQGLFVDGIAGPVTLMHLNRVAGLQEPRLNAPPEIASRIAQTEH